MTTKQSTSPPLHFISQRNLEFIPPNFEQIFFGMGCFWGAERLFWQLEGVYSTAVGYCGGATSHPTYKEVCTGTTNHTEVIKIIFDPTIISLDTLLHSFWQKHDPTEGMRQGNDIGSQYRSAIYTTSKEQLETAKQTQQQYQAALQKQGIMRAITTEVVPAQTFYFAEEYHQQYLAKNPDGYCGLKGTGVCFI